VTRLPIRPDTDVFGRVDIDQDTRTRLDTDPDTDTRTRQDADRGRDFDQDADLDQDFDTDTDVDLDFDRDIERDEDLRRDDERRGGVFSLFAAERDFDSGIAGASETFDAILGGGSTGGDDSRVRDLSADRTEDFEFRY